MRESDGEHDVLTLIYLPVIGQALGAIFYVAVAGLICGLLTGAI